MTLKGYILGRSRAHTVGGLIKELNQPARAAQVN